MSPATAVVNSGYSGQVCLPSARAAAATLVQFYTPTAVFWGQRYARKKKKTFKKSTPSPGLSIHQHLVLWSSAFKLLGMRAAFDEAIHVIKSVKKNNYFGEGGNVPKAVGGNFKGVIFLHVLNCGLQ